MASATSAPSFQEIILRLQEYWSRQGCVILQPYDMEVGAGTFHPATALRALGPKPWNAAYVQPSRRPADGRYGENPNRLQHYYQFQVIMKPSPEDLQELYLGSLQELGLDPLRHDIRFLEDDWESPTLGAAGLGWEVWCDGMEISQFTYFQQVGGFKCRPVSGEITYGLERLAMYLQEVENVFDLDFGGGMTYGDVFLESERQYSRWNFTGDSCIDCAHLKDVIDDDEAAMEMSGKSPDVGERLKRHFQDAVDECMRIFSFPRIDPIGKRDIRTVYPAYDQCIKASHLFNLMDARGMIAVTQREGYIQQVRTLAHLCAKVFLQTKDGGEKG